MILPSRKSPADYFFSPDHAPTNVGAVDLVASAFLVGALADFAPMHMRARLDERLEDLARGAVLAAHVTLLRILHQTGRKPLGVADSERCRQVAGELDVKADAELLTLLSPLPEAPSTAKKGRFPQVAVAVLRAVLANALKGARSYAPARVGGFAQDAAQDATVSVLFAYGARDDAAKIMVKVAWSAGRNRAISMHRELQRLLPVAELPKSAEELTAPEAERVLPTYKRSLQYVSAIGGLPPEQRLGTFADLLETDTETLSAWTGKAKYNLHQNLSRGRKKLRERFANIELDSRLAADLPSDVPGVMRALTEVAYELAELAVEACTVVRLVHSDTPADSCRNSEPRAPRVNDDHDEEEEDSADEKPSGDKFFSSVAKVSALRQRAASENLRVEALKYALRDRDAMLPDAMFTAAAADLLGSDVVDYLEERDQDRMARARRREDEVVTELLERLQAGMVPVAADVLAYACADGSELPEELFAYAASDAASRTLTEALDQRDPARLHAARRRNDEEVDALLATLTQRWLDGDPVE